MSTIIPPSAIAAATAQHRDGATVLDPTVALRRLAPGTQYAGIVIGTTPEGRSLISLDASALTLEADVPLVPGTRVAVRVTATAPALAIELKTLANPAVTRTTVQLPIPQEKNTIAPPAPIAAVQKIDEPPLATATLLVSMRWQDGPIPVGTDPNPTSVQYWLPPGTQLPVRIAVGAPPLPAINAPPSPDIPGTATAPLTPGSRVSAVVYAVLPDGRSVVTLPDGDALVLSRLNALSVGDPLLVTVEGAPLGPAVRNGVALPSASPWTTLAAASSLLQAEASEAVHKIFRAALPRPDASFGANIKALLAAAAAEDPRIWLGDRVVDWLGESRPDLLAGIARDLDEVATTADRRPDTDGWSSVSLPLLAGVAIETIRLRMRQRAAPQSHDIGNNDERFVIDLSLDRLGRVQLDTMVRAPNIARTIAGSARRLDVVVRSEMPLDDTARQNIRALVLSTSEQTGIGITVGFQAAPAGFVEPPAPSVPIASVIV